MKFVEKYTKLFALLGVLSVSVWGMGCANSESTAPKESEKAEAGSTTGGGTKASSGEKSGSADKKTEEKKADDKK